MSLQSQDQPGASPRSNGPVPRILFWVLIATLYLLGALSLLVRLWFDVPPTGATGETPISVMTETAIVTAIATPIPTVSATAESVVSATPAPATPFPTLTPRRTLYPTLTPRP